MFGISTPAVADKMKNVFKQIVFCNVLLSDYLVPEIGDFLLKIFQADVLYLLCI